MLQVIVSAHVRFLHHVFNWLLKQVTLADWRTLACLRDCSPVCWLEHNFPTPLPMICHCSLDNSPGLYIYFGNITARSVRSCRSLLRSPLPPLFIVPHSERRSPIGPFRLGDSESDENEVLRPPVMRWWPDLRKRSSLVPPEQRTHFQSFNDVQLPTPCPITLGTRLRYWPSSPIHAAHTEVLAEICAALFHFNRLIPFWAKKRNLG